MTHISIVDNMVASATMH